MATADQWRWTDEEGVQRLLRGEELRVALVEGRLKPSTLVWRRGMKGWLPASEVPELTAPRDAGPPASAPPSSSPRSRPPPDSLTTRRPMPNNMVDIASLRAQQAAGSPVSSPAPPSSAAAAPPSSVPPPAPSEPTQTESPTGRGRRRKQPASSRRRVSTHMQGTWASDGPPAREENEETVTRVRTEEEKRLAREGKRRGTLPLSGAPVSGRLLPEPPPSVRPSLAAPPDGARVQASAAQPRPPGSAGAPRRTPGQPPPAPRHRRGRADAVPSPAPRPGASAPPPLVQRRPSVGARKKKPPPPRGKAPPSRKKTEMLPTVVGDGEAGARAASPAAGALPGAASRAGAEAGPRGAASPQGDAGPRGDAGPKRNLATEPVRVASTLLGHGRPISSPPPDGTAMAALAATSGRSIRADPVAAPEPEHADEEPIVVGEPHTAAGSDASPTPAPELRGDTPHPGLRGDTPHPGLRGDTPHPGLDAQPRHRAVPTAPLPSFEQLAAAEPAMDRTVPPPEPAMAMGGAEASVDARSSAWTAPRSAAPAVEAAPRRKAAWSPTTGALAAGGGVAVAVALLAFLLGRATAPVSSASTPSSVEPAASAGEPGASQVASAAPSSLQAPRSCLMLRAPERWASEASRSVPFELVTLADGRIAMGYARSAKHAAGLVIDPTTGEIVARHTPDEGSSPLSRVVPVPRGEELAYVETPLKRGPVREEVATGRALIGWADGAIVSSADAGATPTVLWPAEAPAKRPPFALSTASFGAHGLGVTYRLGAHIHYGWLKADGAVGAAGVALGGAGVQVGKPMLGFNGADVSVVYADVPAAEAVGGRGESVRVLWAHGPVGQALGAAEPVALPPGGPGGEAIAPAVAGLSGGRWLLMWTEGTAASGRTLRAQTYGADYAPIGAALRVSPETGSFGQGAVGVAGDKAVVAFLLEVGRRRYQIWGTILQCS